MPPALQLPKDDRPSSPDTETPETPKLAPHAAAADGVLSLPVGEAASPSRAAEKAAVVKVSWTAEEDAKLVALVNELGTGKWGQLAKKLGLERSGKQARERWLNHLSPAVDKQEWKEEEDAIIDEAVVRRCVRAVAPSSPRILRCNSRQRRRPRPLAARPTPRARSHGSRTNAGRSASSCCPDAPTTRARRARWNSNRRKPRRAPGGAPVPSRASPPPKAPNRRPKRAKKEKQPTAKEANAADLLVVWSAASALSLDLASVAAVAPDAEETPDVHTHTAKRPRIGSPGAAALSVDVTPPTEVGEEAAAAGSHIGGEVGRVFGGFAHFLDLAEERERQPASAPAAPVRRSISGDMSVESPLAVKGHSYAAVHALQSLSAGASSVDAKTFFD